MHQTIDVDVICANYNNGKFLDDFFYSVIQSTHQPRKLIFVDDGSSDNSLIIAKRYEGVLNNLKILELRKNKGFAIALNAGIAESSAAYIARVDPDDILYPNRLYLQYQTISKGEIDVLGANAAIYHSKRKKILGRTNFPLQHEEIAKRIESGEHGVLHPTVMVRAKYMHDNLYIQKNVPAEDYDIFARIYKAGARFSNLDDCLIKYRVHEASASNALPFSTIRKTYKIRDELFDKNTSKVAIFSYYLHIKFYRKFLFSSSNFKRLLYGFISALLRPKKVASRVRRAFSKHLMMMV